MPPPAATTNTSARNIRRAFACPREQESLFENNAGLTSTPTAPKRLKLLQRFPGVCNEAIDYDFAFCRGARVCGRRRYERHRNAGRHGDRAQRKARGGRSRHFAGSRRHNAEVDTDQQRRPLLLSATRERLLRRACISQRCVDQLEAQHRSKNWKANGSEAAAAVPGNKLVRVNRSI